jgi:hypothetical protein
MGKHDINQYISIVQGINHMMDLVINLHLEKQLINLDDGLGNSVKVG